MKSSDVCVCPPYLLENVSHLCMLRLEPFNLLVDPLVFLQLIQTGPLTVQVGTEMNNKNQLQSKKQKSLQCSKTIKYELNLLVLVFHKELFNISVLALRHLSVREETVLQYHVINSFKI